MTIKSIQERFTSGNSVPVDKALVPLSEWNEVLEEIRLLQQSVDQTDTLSQEPEISDAQASLLASALGECILASGIVGKDKDGFSGPELLMFAEDLKQMLERSRQPAQEPVVDVPTELGGVLVYTTSGAGGVCGQTLGANGSGEFAVLIYGTTEEAWKISTDLIDNMKRRRHRVKDVMFVPNSDGFTGPLISTIRSNISTPKHQYLSIHG